MATEVEKKEDVVEEKTEDKDTVETGKTPKSYTEDEVNDIVKTRLARKKLDVDAVKGDYESQVKEQEGVITAYEGILKEIIASKLVDVPEQYKELVGKLSVAEQWEFISKEDKTLAPKKVVPSTPIPVNKPEGSEIAASPETKKIRIF